MERRKVEVVVFEDSYYDEVFEILNFVEIIKDAAKKGASHISLSSEYDEGGARLKMYYQRMETDEEFNKRVAYDEYMKNFHLQRERREYERLKQKFAE